MVAPPDNDVLFARALQHSYRGSPALLGVSAGVREGEILGVVGPRGSGKTTLLRCLSGQLVPEQGEVWFNGGPVHTLAAAARDQLRRERFGWVGSEPQLLPELTAWENAALPLLMRGVRSRAARAKAQEWLERLDVGGAARKRPGALLQSERQRVAVARALISVPAVVFADDPAAPLHHSDRAQVLRTLISAARSHGMTVVLAGTDPDTAGYTDRTLPLRDGRSDAAFAVTDRETPDPAPANA
ncbi:ATP-binding cassette domain-containing protein [Streptomyces cocklensis]|uniref:ABC transport system ATP-binding protein n=1 Tax=Actinacidiphila cocklensis TaxID=887465 RepID=A0A9W4GQJ8_9ACTN|nr:ATP-binding cassette domain-containing protein [Actinacidiphila cocklensis]MDD1060058.1 ATP-binding cassette domain-containing protein [Actinacidiphila cocklensis]CAG6391631.1 Putative ABC transport system ATP-binding protein [Actinacidiphila cocklensis]